MWTNVEEYVSSRNILLFVLYKVLNFQEKFPVTFSTEKRIFEL